MLDLLETALSKASGPWLELRLHDRRTRSISVDNGRTESARTVRHCGVGVRAFVDGAWGFASTSLLTVAAIERAIAAATAAAKAASVAKHRVGQKGAHTPADVSWRSGLFMTPSTEPLSSRTLQDKIDLVMRTEALVRAAGNAITSASCSYSELVDEKFIVTSDGARVHLRDDKPELRVNAVAGRDGDLQSCTEASGKTGGFGELFARRTPEQLAERAAKMATDLLRAPFVDGGKKQVILAPDVVGLLVHEAIGHTVEADFVLAGSAAAGKIGKQVASDLVTLCDSGDSEYEGGAGGIVMIDDEGVPSRKVTIIERGILRSYLHNRETAKHFGVEPTGNARAFEYDNEPIIRMRPVRRRWRRWSTASKTAGCWPVRKTVRPTPMPSSCSSSARPTRSRTASSAPCTGAPPSPATPSRCCRRWTPSATRFRGISARATAARASPPRSTPAAPTCAASPPSPAAADSGEPSAGIGSGCHEAA